MEEKEIIEKQQNSAQRTPSMQEVINHLVLGITMWVSASLTCITTLLTVKQPWCLIVLILPFIYTMFPQIQRFTTALVESGYRQVKEAKRERKEEAKIAKVEAKKVKAENIEEVA